MNNFSNNAEICDDRDNNCNNVADEGLLQTYYLDMDGDTWGVDSATITACTMPMGYASRGSDCDDRYTIANPNGTEVCTGGIDEDCDSLIDAADPDCNVAPTICTRQSDCGGLNAAGEVCPMIRRRRKSARKSADSNRTAAERTKPVARFQVRHRLDFAKQRPEQPQAVVTVRSQVSAQTESALRGNVEQFAKPSETAATTISAVLLCTILKNSAGETLSA